MTETPSAMNPVNRIISVLIIEEKSPAATFLPLKTYFESLGWLVYNASTGESALAQIEDGIPDAVLLNPVLPDMDGFEVCRLIRANFKTQLLPVIFSHPVNRDIKLKGLSCGADGHQEIRTINGQIYFGQEELRLHILQLVTASQGYGHFSITGLPSRDFTENRISELIQQNDWALLDVKINGFDEFEETFGFLAAYDLLRLTADLIKNVLSIYGLNKQFVGHLETSRFIIMVPEKSEGEINTKLKERFFAAIPLFCRSIEEELGVVSTESVESEMFNASQLKLVVGVVLGSQGGYTDSQSLFALSDERLRIDQSSPIIYPVSLIKQYIQNMQSYNEWALLKIKIRYFNAYSEIYDEVASRNVVVALQGLITDTLNRLSPNLQYIDRTEDNCFWLITSAGSALQVQEHLKNRFAEMIFSHYYYIHQQEGFIRQNNGDKVPLMNLAIGVCIPSKKMDADAVIKMAEDAEKFDQ